MISPPSSGLPLTTVWLPVLASLLAVYTTPITIETPYALANILIMHSLLFVPLLITSTPTIPPPRAAKRLYMAISFLSFAIRMNTVIPPLLVRASGHWFSPSALWALRQEWSSDLFTALYSHPAQSSISFDVLWTTFSFAVWVFVAPNRSERLSTLNLVVDLVFRGFTLAYMYLSVGLVAPWYYARQES